MNNIINIINNYRAAQRFCFKGDKRPLFIRISEAGSL